jgi:hypothetical protein
MKQILSLLILALFAFGCSQDTGLTDPNLNSPDQSRITASNTDNSGELPLAKIGNKDVKDFLRNHYSRLVFLDGSVGGTINVKYTYPDGAMLEATLRIERGSYDGFKQFFIDFDLSNLSVELSPSGNFDIPVHLNLKYKNVDWSKYPGLDTKNPDFYYIPRNSDELEKVEYKFVKFTGAEGDNSLMVADARLPHFSRFGFVR